jgi:hypothetical protein
MYTKLFGTILDSTVWQEDPYTRLTWITMLAMSDKDGRVEASIPGLAVRAGVSIEQCKTALGKFMSPDIYSRTKDNEGRRIEEIDGGWKLLNHAKYRAIKSKAEHAEAQARHREKKKFPCATCGTEWGTEKMAQACAADCAADKAVA